MKHEVQAPSIHRFIAWIERWHFGSNLLVIWRVRRVRRVIVNPKLFKLWFSELRANNRWLRAYPYRTLHLLTEMPQFWPAKQIPGWYVPWTMGDVWYHTNKQYGPCTTIYLYIVVSCHKVWNTTTWKSNPTSSVVTAGAKEVRYRFF